MQTAVDIVLASLEHGWDQEYGGLNYVTNIDWTPTHELGANLKLWWPHCETLYALLLGWSLTGRQDLWQWYEKVHEYTFAHFPDPEYGEWYGYLDRDGKPVGPPRPTAGSVSSTCRGCCSAATSCSIRSPATLDDMTMDDAGLATIASAARRRPAAACSIWPASAWWLRSAGCCSASTRP